MPLTQQEVKDRLRPPAAGEVRVAAEQIAHPILRPMLFDPRDGFSPDEFAVLGVLVNPGLRGERDRQNLAVAQVIQARLLPNPQLSWTMDFPSGGTTAGTVNANGLGVGWDITSLIGYSARVDAAAAQPVAVALDVAWLEWIVAESSKSAAYTLFGLRKQAALAEELDDHLRENRDVIRRAVNDGLKTELDLAAAEAASIEAHASLLDLQNQVAQQQIQLNRLVGMPAEAAVRLQDDVDLPTAWTPPPAEQFIAGLADRRLDLMGLRYGYLSQEATLRAAVLAQFPKVNLGVINARDTGDVVTTGFGISVDAPVFDRNQGVIAQETATRQKLFDEYVNRFFQARTDIVMLLTRIEWLNRQIATAQVAQAKQQLLVETYRAAVDRGQADVIVYYSAWTTLNQRQIGTVKLQQALIETLVALELAAGIYDLESLEMLPLMPEEVLPPAASIREEPPP
ncbi:MAG: TolC family protein [Pirellulaceae bacterium]